MVNIKELPYLEGIHFFVLFWKGYVFKYPKKNISNEELRTLVNIQNYLSDITNCPNATLVDKVIVEKEISGKSLSVIKETLNEEEKKYIKKTCNEMLEEIKRRGYLLKDRTDGNVMYNRNSRKVTLIDFYNIYNTNGKTETRRAWEEQPKIL